MARGSGREAGSSGMLHIWMCQSQLTDITHPGGKQAGGHPAAWKQGCCLPACSLPPHWGWKLWVLYKGKLEEC